MSEFLGDELMKEAEPRTTPPAPMVGMDGIAEKVEEKGGGTGAGFPAAAKERGETEG